MIRRAGIVVVLLLILTACGSSGEPETFGEQFVELSAEEQALYGTDAEIPVELRNWMEGCVGSAASGDTQVTNPAAACKCSFDGIVEFLLEFSSGATELDRQQEAFATFKDLDTAAEAGDPFQTQIRDIIDGCNS